MEYQTYDTFNPKAFEKNIIIKYDFPSEIIINSIIIISIGTAVYFGTKYYFKWQESKKSPQANTQD
jgi:hypothetical protein